VAAVIWFSDDDATRHESVGGKGRNLALLAHAGFDVPPGFVVASEGYAEFMRAAGLDRELPAFLAGLDYADPAALEAATASFRKHLLDAPMPGAVAKEITEAYAALGPDPYVAVRSSGTAEDMADASFAGLHDTFLDVKGADSVIDAVKDCWASLWTARATAYRKARGFDHLAVSLPVVVQMMAEADVAGVMFTANPLTAATNEIVINASWGLGESVVSGAVTPDEFVIDTDTLRVKRRILGSKARETVRNPQSGRGTLTREVDEDRRSAYSLTDDQLNALARLGRRITRHYREVPQDIEWALVDGRIHVLQSRNVTGVDFTWDEDLDAWQTDPDDPETVWTLQWSNDFWNGATSPLHYSVRSYEFLCAQRYLRNNLGATDMLGLRMFKYWRGRAYYNTKLDALNAQNLAPPSLRAGMLNNVHPDDRQAVLDAPFDKSRLARTVIRQLSDPRSGPYAWLKLSYAYMAEREANEGLTAEALHELSDVELKAHIDSRIQRWIDFNNQMWLGFFTWGAWSIQAIASLLLKWFPNMDEGEFTSTLQDLISGLPLPVNKQAEERQELWRLGNIIRNSPELTSLFKQHEGTAFFDQLGDSEEGRAFQREYTSFIAEYGARGTADRDWFYPRRVEDPNLDYNSFQAVLKAENNVAPLELEHKRRIQREAITQQLLSQLRDAPLGFLKAEAFKVVLDYAYRLLRLREDQRHYLDVVGQSKKRGWLELGERLVVRGLLAQVDDIFFLTWDQAYALLDGQSDHELDFLQLKITGRRAVFEKVHRRELAHSMYLKDQAAYETGGHDDVALAGEQDVLQGAGTSVGMVTGRARIVQNLEALPTLQAGEILVCNATDPGWATAFLMIKGLVIEEGGLLSHGACLSREYGLPAVTLQNAMRRIPNGAIITLDGARGRVEIVSTDDGESEQVSADGSPTPIGR
jgi:pyruvate,water dikinase